MRNDRWQRIREVFDRVIDVAPSARAEWLATNLAAEQDIRAEVEALLRAHSDTELQHTRLSESLTSRTAALEGPGTVIDRYRIVSEIGEGGFGKVYLAEQQEPIQRKVALKIIKPGMDTAQVIARFEAERQTLALMDHDAIAKVYDAGATATGRPYFVMELVNGVPITKFCDDERLDTTQRIELFVHVCHAVQHAHQKGIVHRDIKPSNLLVALNDGRPVPKVIDFGIAKAMQPRAEGQVPFTTDRQIIGTPQYMSPEQASAGYGDLDTRSDIYSLGVVLYEILTGSTPFEMRTTGPAAYDAMLRQICEIDPPTPSSRVSTRSTDSVEIATQRGTDLRRLRESIRGDLDWIVMKALAKDRNRRYPTANALAMDLGRHLRGLPVEAGPPRLTYRLQKFVRRNFVAVASLGAIFASLVIGLGVALWQYRDARENAFLAAQNAETANRNAARAEQREREAVASADRATRAETEAKAALEREKDALNVANGHRLSAQAITLAKEDPTLALLLAIEGARRATGADIQAALYAALDHHRETAILRGHDAESRVLDLTADDRFVLSADQSGLCIISDLREARATRIYELPEASARSGVATAAFHRDARHAFALTRDGVLYELDDTGACAAIRSASASVSFAEYAPKDSVIVIGGPDGEVRALPIAASGAETVIARHAAAIAALALSSDGNLVASLDANMKLSVTDRALGTEIARIELAPGDMNPTVYNAKTWHSPSLQFDATAHRLLARARNGQLTALEVSSGRIEWQIDPGERINGYAAITQDGRFVVSALFLRPNLHESSEGVYLLDAATGRDVRQLSTTILGAQLDIEFDPSGKRVVISGNRGADGWMLETGARIGPIPSPAHRFGGMRFTHDGERVIAGSSGGDIIAFRLSAYPGSTTWVKDEIEHRIHVHSVAGDGRRALVVRRKDPGVDGPEDTVWALDTATGSEIAQVLKPGSAVSEYVISRSGRFAIVMEEGQPGHLFDLDSRTSRHLAVSNLKRLKFSPDERFLSGADFATGTVVAIDLESGAEIGRVRSECFTAQVSSGGKFLAIVSGSSSKVYVHSLPDGDRVHTIDHNGFTFDLAFAGDPARLVTLANDTTSLIFDSSNWERMTRTTVPTGDLGYVDFSLDGRHSLVKLDDHLVLIDAEDGSITARWDRPGLVGALFSADSQWLRWSLIDGSIVKLPLDPLSYAKSLVPRLMTTEEMTRYDVGTPEERQARRLELDRIPDSMRNLMVRGEEAIHNREIERGLMLLDRAAQVRTRLPARIHFARACALALRMVSWPETADGQAKRAQDRDASLKELELLRAGGYPPSAFREAEELAGLRGEPGAEWVFEAGAER